MRILLTGRQGQVGFELQRALAPLGDLLAFDRNECDLENEESLRDIVRRHKPEVIVNAAAYTAVDRAESEVDRAFAINGAALGILGEEGARCGALVVHYSTDYVFDGRCDGYYDETAPTAPQSVYGHSKLAGEMKLAASGARYLIFRTSWVFGVHGANFAKTMLRLALEREELRVVADQVGAPTSAALIADVTAHALRQVSKSPALPQSGIYHLAAAGETSWDEYACYIIEAARGAGSPIKPRPDQIHAISTAEYLTPATRPANSRLNTAKLRRTFDLNLPDWRYGMNYFLQQIRVGL